MNPQYPEQNPYDFIMNPNQPAPKRPLDISGKNGFALKIGMIVGALIIIMIAASLLINLFTGNRTNTADLQALAQSQQEIIRVAQVANGGSGLRDQSLKNFATNTQLTVATQQTALLAYLTKHDAKMSPKTLGLKKDDQTDKQLAQARATSTYDIAFQQIAARQLANYSNELQTNFNNATEKDVRSYLQESYQNVQLLRAQMPTPSNTTTP